MKLFIVRHALAEDRLVWAKSGKSDALRPLTKNGIVKFTEAIEGFAIYCKRVDFIYSSQLTRAVQTAEILHGHFTDSQLLITEDLNPDMNFKKMLNKMIKQHKEHVVVLVGHQPDLSLLTGRFLNCDKKVFFDFKKGGICSLEVLNREKKFNWFLSSSQLIAIRNGIKIEALNHLID